MGGGVVVDQILQGLFSILYVWFHVCGKAE